MNKKTIEHMGNLKTLHLVLKRKWWDMIASGVKTEEYREYKPYYVGRFIVNDYSLVTFHLGYTNKIMIFKIKSIRVGEGRTEWGAEPGKQYFIIELGERL